MADHEHASFVNAVNAIYLYCVDGRKGDVFVHHFPKILHSLDTLSKYHGMSTSATVPEGRLMQFVKM